MNQWMLISNKLLTLSRIHRTVKGLLMPALAKYPPQEDENGYESLEIKGAVQSSEEL